MLKRVLTVLRVLALWDEVDEGVAVGGGGGAVEGDGGNGGVGGVGRG